MPGYRKRSVSWLAAALCLSLVFGTLSAVFSPAAEAASSRIATVTSVSGTVEVLKSGGSRTFDAYVDLELYAGDKITTGSSGSVVLYVSDADQEVTLGANGELYVSQLSESGGKKSKFKLWAGNMWVKVKKLVGADDDFEVETQTAVMGVRGTEFFVGIDPATGYAYAWVGSGVIRSIQQITPDGTPDDEREEVYIYPAQQLMLEPSGDNPLGLTPIAPLDLISFASPAVIEAILRSIPDIDRENEQLIEQFLDGSRQFAGDNGFSFMENSPELIGKYADNIEALLRHIAKLAADRNIVDRNLIDEVNGKIDSDKDKIDLNNPKPFDPTIGYDPQTGKALKELAEQQQKRREQLAKEQEETRKKKEQELAALKEKVEQERKKLQQANEDAKRAAEEEAAKKLRERLNEQAKQQFEANRAAKSPTPSPTPGGGGSGGGGQQPTPTPTPSPYLKLSGPADVVVGSSFDLELRLEDFAAGSAIRAIEVQVEYNPDAARYDEQGQTQHGGDSVLTQDRYVESIATHDHEPAGDGTRSTTLIYAAVLKAGSVSNDLGSHGSLVTIPMRAGDVLGSAQIRVTFVEVVMQDGSRRELAPTANGTYTFVLRYPTV